MSKVYPYVEHYETYLSPEESHFIKNKRCTGYRLPGERFLYLLIQISDVEKYLVPQFYEVADGSTFILKNHGSFNLIYYPFDIKKNAVIDRPDFVYRMLFSADDKMDTPERTIRLWNDFYREAYPDRPELSKARLYGDGALIPYIFYRLERLPNLEIIHYICKSYEVYGRIFLDAFAENNIVKGVDGDIYIVDFNAILKVKNDKAFESNKSIVSDEASIELFSIYASFFQELFVNENKEMMEKSGDLYFEPRRSVIALLILFTALGIELKSAFDFFECDENGFKNGPIITKFLKFFIWRNQFQCSNEELGFFKNNPEEIIEEKVELLRRYKEKYKLNGAKINLAVLHPSLKYYDRAFEKFSYFDRVAELDIQYELLYSYDLTNPKIFYTLAYMLLRQDVNEVLTKDNFSDQFKKYMSYDISSDYYEALMSLAEKAREHDDHLYAYRILRHLSVVDAQFLDKGYAFYLRKAHLNENLSNRVETQNALLLLLALYKKNNTPYNLEQLVYLPAKALTTLIDKEKGFVEKSIAAYRFFSSAVSTSVGEGLRVVQNSCCSIM